MSALSLSFSADCLALNPQTYPPVLHELSNRHLPVLPHGAQDLLMQLNDENTDFEQVAASLEHFPTIVARLISLANSAWSAPRAEITSLAMACSRLGLNVVRSTSIALAVAAPFNLLHCPQFNARKYWTSALCTAEISYQLAKLLPEYEQAQTARACGLLHNLGLLWLADQLPVLTHQSIQRRESDQDISLDQSLFEIVGAGYTQAGAYLATLWELPSVFEQTMAFHRLPEKQPNDIVETRIVAAAIKLLGIACTSTDDEPNDELAEQNVHTLEETAQTLNLKPTVLQELSQKLPTDIERCSALADTLFGAQYE